MGYSDYIITLYSLRAFALWTLEKHVDESKMVTQVVFCKEKNIRAVIKK